MSQLETGLSDELRRVVLERSHEVVTLLETDGTIAYASPAWHTELGWEPAALVGRSILELIHPEDHATARGAMAEIAAGGTTGSIRARLRTADGRWLWIDTTGIPVRDDEGRVAHLLGTARDVSEREELRLRVRELNALYQVADAVATARDLETLFGKALDALIEATTADRASLLLYGEDGVMRFRAWRGLSDDYRTATEGHSPWRRETVDPQPVLVADVAAAGLDPALAAAIEAEGIAALAFVPLVHTGRLVGKFMLYTDTPHAWDEREIRLCLTIANHLASATVRTQTGAELRRQREQLQTIMATVEEGIIVQAPDLSRIYANEAAARATGLESADEMLTADVAETISGFDLFDEHGSALSPDDLPGRRAFDGRTHERLVCYRRRSSGGEHWALIRANPVHGEDDSIVATVSVIHDLTERFDTERQARESSALVEGVFRNAPVGLAFWDRELRYQRVNDELVEINGIPAEEMIGRPVFDVLPSLESQLRDTLHHVLETGEPVLGLEVRGETPAQPGVERIWQTSWYAVRDDGGAILGVGGIVSDITEERRAERRIHFLARAGALLNRTLDSAETLGALADIAVPEFAGHVTVDLLVDGALRCVGAQHVDPGKTALMRELRERYPPTVGDHPVQRALQTGEPQFVADVQRDAGAMAHDAAHAAAIAALGNESGIVVPLQARGTTLGAITFGSVPPQRRFDTADLELAVELGRRASVALDNALLFEQAQARAHAADALQFVDDGVFLVDREGIVRLWNPAAARTFRARADQAVGRHVSESIDDWETLRERVAGARRPETLPLSVRGEERWISASAARFPGGTVYAFRDVTQEQRVEQLRSDFVSTVSHELRTPLAAIYGAALTLQRDDVRLEESQRTGLLDVIAGEADRLARIVNDILWASRLDSGQMGIAIESCSAEAIAAKVVDALKTHTPAGIALDLDTEPGLPPVAADPDKLRQVLTNLLDNAVKYSPDGGRVHLLVTRSSNRIRFRVRDEGLGIPPAEQSRVFEKFFRLDPQMTRGVGGTGLGLYICRELVERMHGRIGVNSDGRSGSTFWVELPVAQ